MLAQNEIHINMGWLSQEKVVLLSDFSKKQFENYTPNIISDLWQYAYYAGFKEFKIKWLKEWEKAWKELKSWWWN